ncbi:uncharacterized protein LOC113505986 [Trichoplusia ni]|uniref:Uncharacterized protein LOC113505986 n=1 Tax=Trichoplusia ni TaxID=7111 RepID=A0A7E5WUY3_TRINI|nr:uncharacterized protein LOC113505986 [Trichoplusia ni]
MVYLKHHHRLRKALSPIWKGPYKIIKVHNKHNVTLQLYLNLFIFYFRILSCQVISGLSLVESNIIPIYHSPGIYFEPISNIFFYNDNWKIVTHIDIISLEPYLKNIEKVLTNSIDLCKKIQSEDVDSCKDISNPIEILTMSNYVKLESLSHIIAKKSNKTKRSLEFGGEILKFFFGTLDADDARKYDAAIESCKKSETEMFHLMRDNIHVVKSWFLLFLWVKSTINNFNKTIDNLNRNEIRLNNQINNINKIFSQITKNDDILFYTSKLNNLLNIIEGSLLTISSLLDTTLNSILFSKINILHPSVLSNLRLFNELSKYNNYINKRQDFPIALSIENIHSLIDVSKLSSYYFNNKNVFVLQIPLVTPDKFIVYKILPLPIPHDDLSKTFALIIPTNTYIALSDDRLHYVMLDTLDKYKQINHNYSICELTTVYSPCFGRHVKLWVPASTLSNPNCESKLLTEVTLSMPPDCNSKILYGEIDIWQKLQNNRWIYVQSRSTKLTIRCNDDINDYSLTGTGIVKLSTNCIGYSKTIQLNPTMSYSFMVKSPLDISFDITADDCCKKDVFNKSLLSLEPIHLSNINLDSLKHASREMDNLESQINNLEKESHLKSIIILRVLLVQDAVFKYLIIAITIQKLNLSFQMQLK